MIIGDAEQVGASGGLCVPRHVHTLLTTQSIGEKEGLTPFLELFWAFRVVNFKGIGALSNGMAKELFKDMSRNTVTLMFTGAPFHERRDLLEKAKEVRPSRLKYRWRPEPSPR